MKVAPLSRTFDSVEEIEHIIVHTGQHYDKNMSDAFFEDLDMPQPKHFLNVGSATHSEQTARIMIEFEKVLDIEKPNMVIVVGDVNSTIACALTATKKNILVSHIEAGLRSFDRSMPEEINRLATDAICDFAFVSEPSGMKHLKEENFPLEKTFFVGNNMIDSQYYGLKKLESREDLKGLIPKDDYALITIHRPSNVDNKQQLSMLMNLLNEYSKQFKIILQVLIAAFPSHNSGILPFLNLPFKTLSNASLINFSSGITNSLVPTSTVIGRSVLFLSVIQGTFNAVVSSWTPPESVMTKRASFIKFKNFK